MFIPERYILAAANTNNLFYFQRKNLGRRLLGLPKLPLAIQKELKILADGGFITAQALFDLDQIT